MAFKRNLRVLITSIFPEFIYWFFARVWDFLIWNWEKRRLFLIGNGADIWPLVIGRKMVWPLRVRILLEKNVIYEKADQLFYRRSVVLTRHMPGVFLKLKSLNDPRCGCIIKSQNRKKDIYREKNIYKSMIIFNYNKITFDSIPNYITYILNTSTNEKKINKVVHSFFHSLQNCEHHTENINFFMKFKY